MKKIKIAAGLAHVDYGHLADLARVATEAGADYIHSDAADMHDLKNMQLMGCVIKSLTELEKHTDLPIECHIYTKNL